MKKLFFLSLLFLSLISMGQNKMSIDKSWYLGVYQIENENQEAEMTQKINKIVEQGFTPTGFDVNGNIFYILFSKDFNIKVDRWGIFPFPKKDFTALITAGIKKGAIPMDMVYIPANEIKKDGKVQKIEERFDVLMVYPKEKFEISGWHTDPIFIDEDSLKTAQNVKKSIDSQRLLKQYPFGITQISNNALLFFYLKLIKGNSIKEFYLRTYPNDGNSVFGGLDYEVSKSKVIPWGISLINNEIWITYISK